MESWSLTRTVSALLAATALASLSPAQGQGDLGPGDRVPNCEKILLKRLQESGDHGPPGTMFEADAVVRSEYPMVLHFTTTLQYFDPARGGLHLPLELSALSKGTERVPYWCKCVVVLCVPDSVAAKLMADPEWAYNPYRRQAEIYADQGWPRPGLYRLFRPGSVAGGDGERDLLLPMTYIIHEGRIRAVRRPNEAQLVDWVRDHLPPDITPEVRQPVGNLTVVPPATETWPCFMRTLDHRPFIERAVEGGRLAPAWEAEVGPSLCSPCVVDGIIFCPTERGISTVDLASGTVIESSPRRQFGSQGFYWSSPCAAGGRFYVGAADGRLLALTADPLAAVSQVKLGPRISASPVVSDGRVFVGSHDGNMYAVDAEEMLTLWAFPTGGTVCSSVALWRDKLYFGSSDHYIYALRQADGSPVWSFCADGAVDASPCVDRGRVYVGSFGGSFYCLDAETGECLATRHLGGWLHSSPIVHEGNVYVGSRQGGFYRLAADDLELLDEWQMPDSIYGSPTVWGDWVMIGCRDGVFRGFRAGDLASGPVWQQRSGGRMHSNPVVVGDHVLMNSTDGRLRCYGLRPPLAPWGEGQEAGEVRTFTEDGLSTEMVWVPAGRFTMGMTPEDIDLAWELQGWDEEDKYMMQDAQPAHEVELDGFWIGVTEITNDQWQAFVDETGYEWRSMVGDRDFPVTNVSWNDAQAFCNWYGLRLPTEAEWEHAARGPEGRVFPWGDELSAQYANYDDTGDRGEEPEEFLQPVGMYEAGRSWCGALDLAGSVSEWCMDVYDPGYYGRSPEKDPAGPSESDGERCLRGGDWYRLGMSCLSACRGSESPTSRSNLNGFRVVRDP